MNSKSKALYFLAGILFASILFIVSPVFGGYAKSDWINIFVAFGTFAAVLSALYISQRQEMLRNKQNLHLGYLSLIQVEIKLDALASTCSVLAVEIRDSKKLLDEFERFGSPQHIKYKDFSASDLIDRYLNPHDYDITRDEVVAISFVSFELAEALTYGLDLLKRLRRFAAANDSKIALLSEDAFTEHKDRLIFLVNLAQKEFVKASKIEANLKQKRKYH